MARLLTAQGRLNELAAVYEATLRRRPNWPDLEFNLANLLAGQGRLEEAVVHYRACIRSSRARRMPGNLEAALARLGSLHEAVTQFELALQAKPDFPEAHDQLGGVLQRLGEFSSARDHYAEAVRLKPGFARAHSKLGVLLAQEGKFEAATSQFRETLRLQPDSIEALGSLAWILATNPKPEFRNGAEAVRLAEHVCELTARRDARCLAALDAAYAEAGRFDDAIKTVKQVQELAAANNQPAIAEQAAQRLALYTCRQALPRVTVMPR